MTPDEVFISLTQLRDLREVQGALGEVLPRSVFQAWFNSPHPGLKGEAPADVILRGDKQTVLNLIDAMAEGVFM